MDQQITDSESVPLPAGKGIFTPVFQPVLEARVLPSRKVAFFEMLMRLRGDGGDVAPGPLIEFAEAKGFIADLDLEMLELGLKWLARSKDLALSVNLSLDTVEHFFDEVGMRLDTVHDSCRDRLVFEVTETRRPESYESIRRGAAEFRRRGVRMAVDDFGDGFSDQHLLDAVLPSIIKISGGVLDDPGFVTSCVAYARAMGADVVAERVTSDDQIMRLHAQGVRYVQGFVLERPVSNPVLWLDAALQD